MKDITIANIIINFVKKRKDDVDWVVPIGPLYVASALESAGFKVDFRDYQLYSCKDPLNPDSVLSFLEGCSEVVGISCASDTLPLVILSLEKLKEKYPHKTVILGGFGPTGAAEEILKNFDFVDIVVKGEGEQTIVKLMNSLDRPENVHGICYRNNERVCTNLAQEPIQNLDNIPFPAYTKTNLKDYLYLSIISSRGCPYRCGFCECPSFWQHQHRERTIENVIQEIKLLREIYGSKLDINSDGTRNTEGAVLILHDETFVVNRKRVLEFCDRLEEEDLNIQWMAMGRINLMDEELMRRMSSSGCVEIFYGIESGSDRVLRQMKKRITVKRAGKVISKSLQYFEGVTAFFIWGFPFETMKDFHNTIEFISHLSKMGASPVVYSLAPLPLSPLYHQYKDDLVFSEEFFASSHLIKQKEMVDLIKEYPTVFPGYYTWESAKMLEKLKIARKLGVEAPFLP